MRYVACKKSMLFLSSVRYMGRKRISCGHIIKQESHDLWTLISSPKPFLFSYFKHGIKEGIGGADVDQILMPERSGDMHGKIKGRKAWDEDHGHEVSWIISLLSY